MVQNTLTLETLHSYRTELDSSGAPKLDSKKFNGIGSLFALAFILLPY